MNYADRIGVPFVAFLGEDEVRSGVASLKDMSSGEQEKVELARAPEWLREKVEERNRGTVIRG